jgi:hypothetical protein
MPTTLGDQETAITKMGGRSAWVEHKAKNNSKQVLTSSRMEACKQFLKSSPQDRAAFEKARGPQDGEIAAAIYCSSSGTDKSIVDKIFSENGKWKPEDPFRQKVNKWLRAWGWQI